MMLKFIVAVPLIMHGLANLGGAFAPWSKSGAGFKNAAWLFSQNLTFFSGVGKAFSLVWLTSTALLIAAGAGLLLKQPWWVGAAMAGSICSMIAIVPWVRAVPPGAYAGAIFDVLVLIALLSPLKNAILQAMR